jgi:hypothetical protein
MFFKEPDVFSSWFFMYLKNWASLVFKVLANGDYEVGARVWLGDWLGIRLESLIKIWMGITKFLKWGIIKFLKIHT